LFSNEQNKPQHQHSFSSDVYHNYLQEKTGFFASGLEVGREVEVLLKNGLNGEEYLRLDDSLAECEFQWSSVVQ
jgi:hypothetical protein